MMMKKKYIFFFGIAIIYLLTSCFTIANANSASEALVVVENANDDLSSNHNAPQQPISAYDTNIGVDGTGIDEGWRKLEPDEGVPVGSYVRMNLATGEKFVKIEPNKDLSNTPSPPTENERFETMERVLRSLPKPDQELPSPSMRDQLGEKKYQEMLQKVWNKRQQQIKEAMDALDDDIKVMKQNVKTLLDASLGTVNDAEVLRTLEATEYMVEDVDHAYNFAQMGGIDVTLSLLSNPNVEIRNWAIQTLGSAINNNADLQQKAYKAGMLQAVLMHLDRSLPCESATSGIECSKMLYGLGALVRGHEHALKDALDSNLLVKLGQIIGEPTVARKPLLKALALIHDIFQNTVPESCSEVISDSKASGKLCAILEKSCEAFSASLLNGDLDLSNKFREALSATSCKMDCANKIPVVKSLE